ncbi:abortive infection family protein [Spirosoma endophyticum]|nr:abortive infection family protein [Spirosoma endophyticum]
MNSKELYDKVEYVQNMLISRATGGHAADSDYRNIRNELSTNQLINRFLPSYLNTNRSLGQFWQFIKNKFGSYEERRNFIWDSFKPVLELLERNSNALISPNDESVSSTLNDFNAEYVNLQWQKALQRRFDDPEAAITSSRTLIESVCKHILDKQSVEYDNEADLSKLYDKAAESLNLAPSQHTESIFKQILGGCKSVVIGLGSIRNKLSDSHGKGSIQAKPSARHAELAVNLAGSMASFLIQTYKAKADEKE